MTVLDPSPEAQRHRFLAACAEAGRPDITCEIKGTFLRWHAPDPHDPETRRVVWRAAQYAVFATTPVVVCIDCFAQGTHGYIACGHTTPDLPGSDARLPYRAEAENESQLAGERHEA